MISLNAAITIAILSLITGGCISASLRNLRGKRRAIRFTANKNKTGWNKRYIRIGKNPFRGAIYAAVGVIVWFLDVVAIFLSVR